MKIGYLMQNGVPDLSINSGPTLHVTEIVFGLMKLGHSVRTAAIQQNLLGWSDNLTEWNVPMYGFTKSKGFRFLESSFRRLQYEFKLPFFGLFDSLHYADACQQLLSDFDIMYERHGFMGYGGVITSRCLKMPIVIEINGNILKEIDEIGIKMTSLQRKIAQWLTYRTWKEATHLLVVSEALKNQLIKSVQIDEDRITVLRNGANVELFSRKYNNSDLSQKYHLGSSKIIAFTGSFQPWHGIELLIDSFALLKDKHPESRLVLIGNGNSFDTIKSTVSAMGLERSVIFTGQLPQEDVACLLSIADILVAPYPFKHPDILGSPLKIIEYMAAGKAIVATKAPIHEIILDGYNGIRVEPADANSLAEGIDRLLEDQDLRLRLGANARQEAQIYSWEIVVRNLERLMYELVERSKV